MSSFLPQPSKNYPIPARNKRILIIGAAHAPPICEVYPILLGLGYEIINVGSPKPLENDGHPLETHLNLINCKTKVQTFNMNMFGMGTNSVGIIREVKLESILDLLGDDNFDFILHFQDFTFTQEIKKFRIPYFYIMSEGWVHWVPKSAWKVYGGTEGIKEIISYFHPNLPVGLSSYCPLLRFSQSSIPKERPVKISFAGVLYKMEEIYKERREIVEFIHEKMDEAEIHVPAGRWNSWDEASPKIGKGFLQLNNYIDLLMHSKIGLNVPTPFGTNYRDFEICATGAMLLTIETSDHKLLGFKDGVNCRFYKTKEEALEIIQTISDEDIARIGTEGKIFVNKDHNYAKRVMELLTDIEGIINHEKSL